MRRRLLWIAGLIAALGIVITLGIWLGGMSLDRRFDELSAEATLLGMNLTLPERPSNPEAERLRSEIDAFGDTLLPSTTGRRNYFSENPDELRLLRRDLGPILPKVFALSNCKSFGASDLTRLDVEVINCAEFLLVEGNSAIASGDTARMVEAGAAIRRIAHLHSSDGVSGAAILVLVIQIYADLLQRGAYAARTVAELELISEEASRWQILNLKKTASNLIAEEFYSIEEEAELPIETKNPLEYANELAWRTEPGILKSKIFALRAGVEIYKHWSDDAKAWATINRTDIAGFDVAYFAQFLKLSELDLRRKFASVWATLLSRRQQMQDGTWPSITELEALGIEVRDPITGNKFEWREIDGKKRLYGKFHTYGNTVTEEFLLASDSERERLRISGK